ncbi:RNA-guided pseudouridylation complex pseudouridine synthase subunit Cbf5 [Candidatus Woesearchaeota archaeon]|nr:RNA-guided pseudouridylation complex pseudouridine synthase subunit Cbf5 [Candidatus Woesearchaeota archaeon]
MTQELPFEKITRKILVKKESPTSDKYGCRPEARTVEQHLDLGIINIDKPKGPTSHQVSAYVQKILNKKKGGHSGTLDPKVTGVLPVAIGKATRIVQALLVAGKEYVCIMHLHKEIPEADIRKVMVEFTGNIMQLPPLKSAVKRQVRQRRIYYIEILDIIGQDVLFVVGCQAGTYIRKLCHDIGKKLGTGAHMAELRRTKAGPFNESTLATLQDLTDAYFYWTSDKNDKLIRKVVQPVENAVAHMPKVWVMDTTVDTLCHGAALGVPGIAKVHEGIEKDQPIAIMTLKEELVALGRARMNTKEMMQKDRGLAVKTDKVFMESGTYPKMPKREPETGQKQE